MAENKPLVYLPPFHEAQKIVAADSSRFIVINAGRRWGKALSLDTPILTTEGWSTMGELRVGQMVFGVNGKPTRVVEATEVMFGHDVYEVHFSDGSVIKADADHQWFVHSKAYRKRPGHKCKMVYTTRELIEAGVNLLRSDGRVEHRFAVPVAAPPRSVKTDTSRRFITAIVPIQSEPVRCIAVDNADHLFLAGEALIPTHNSWFARMMCLDHAINQGHQVWWISPTYGNVWDHWQQTLSMVGDLPTYKNVQQKYLEFNYRGQKGSLSFKSGERPDNLRGSGLDYVVLDEAAFIHPDVWEAVVRPALSDKRGRALIISTPNGVGDWYHRSYLRGLDPSYEEWNTYHFPTTANSTIPGIKQEVEQAKRDMDDLRFRQEYLAEFVDYAGGVFYGLQEAATAPLITIPVDGHAYYAGIDIGRRNDFTVISIIDLLERDFARQVAIERFSSMSFVAQEEKITKTLEEWDIAKAFIENNSIAMPLVEALLARGLPIVDHATSSANKGPMIEKLSANIQRGRLELLSPESAIGQVQLSEMQAFEMNKNASGYISYGAKRGWHDDTVMALAFANMAIRSRGKGAKQSENPFYH